MIDPTSTSNRTLPLDRFASSGASASRSLGARADYLAAETVTFLHTELIRQPEIRAEVVERARALAADPNYPSPSINQTLARMILAAPDYSEHDI